MPVQPKLSSTARTLVASLPGPIMVLGADGFIGSNLALCINQYRNDVYAITHKSPALRIDTQVSSAQIRHLDIRNDVEVGNLFSRIVPAVIFDCVTYGGYSYQQEIERIFVTNFNAKVRMLEGLASRSIQAYVHAGTSSEYGLNCRAPSEDSLLQPNSHYAVSKAAFAHYLAYLGKVRKFPCINLRLYSVYGPLEEETRLIPTLVRHALQNEYPPFVHPNISRDFVFIEDVCEAFILAAGYMSPELHGESINIGTGVRTTMADLAMLTQQLFDIAGTPRFGSMENRSWDVSEWYADPSKARRAIHWQANTSLGEGLVKTAKWFGVPN